MKRIILFLFFLIYATNLNSNTLFDEVSDKVKSNIKKIQLENGLKVIMMQRKNVPTLALYIKFRVGAVDETPEIAGTAHLLEHMMFKGTKNIGTLDYSKEEKYQEQIRVWGKELDRLKLQARENTNQPISNELRPKIEILSRRLKNLENLQREILVKNEDSFIYDQHGQTGFNAYTSQDVTNYQIELPKNRLEIWAKMESDRLTNPVFREYYTEREVIQEVRRMRVDNRGIGSLREKFLSLAFESHPYRMPIIGYESNIPFLDIDETEKFFRKYYAPNNFVITIVGNQDFQNTEKIIRKYFSHLKPKPIESYFRIAEKIGNGEKRFEINFPSGPQILMGWHKPTFPHPDNFVFEMIDLILSKGAESRLNKRLIFQEKLAIGADAWNGDPGERYSNLFAILTTINSSVDHKQVEKIIWEEVEKLKTEDVEDEEIHRIKNQLIADFFRGLDNNANLADYLSYYEVVTGNWENLFSAYEKIHSVSKEDIKRVSKKYLTKENSTIGYLIDSRKKK
ncbi:MAG: insulinase family protein [Leptospiraceae bacterium]|nr:insulinase family protein [Leptospiraceae bacterium]